MDRVLSMTAAQRIESRHMPIETILFLDQALVPDDESLFSFDKYVWQPDKAEEFWQHMFSVSSICAISDACDMIEVDINRAVELYRNNMLDAGNCKRKLIKNRQQAEKSVV